LFATVIDDELKNILGQNSYQSQKKFLNILFKNERIFYTGSSIDIHKILDILNKNSLLRLNLKKTEDLHISFATEQNNPLIFMKLIQDSLNTLGYSHISSQKVMRDSSGFLWKVTIKATSAIDPVLLARELTKRNCYYTKIKRYSKTNWRYNIDIRNIDIVADEIAFNKRVKLNKPLTPYWIYIDRAKTLVLNSSRANSWHPYIVFYDKDLNVIEIVTKQRKSYNEQLKIPKGSKYVKVSDIFTLENIKRGLNIFISR
jgi:hypothetical protein